MKKKCYYKGKERGLDSVKTLIALTPVNISASDWNTELLKTDIGQQGYAISNIVD